MGHSILMTLFGKPWWIMPPTKDPSTTSPDQPGRERALMEEATAWFMRQGASDFSQEDRARLEAWLKQHPAHDRAFRRVGLLWDSPDMSVAAERVAGSTDIGDMKPAPRQGGRYGSRRALIAASVLLVGLAFWSNEVLTWIHADYVTAIGERRVVTLPDRSVLTLNTDSAVAVQYSMNRREVRLLRGEASFTVQPDADRPFVVETQGVTATALGTEFQVRDRKENVQVTVLHGTVEVARAEASSATAVRLTSGHQVVVGPQGPGAVVEIDAATSAAWMKGRLVFVGVPLTEVIEELSRYHRGYLTIWNPDLRTLPVTGIYKLADPARIIATLADTLPIQLVRITDHLIIVR